MHGNCSNVLRTSIIAVCLVVFAVELNALRSVNVSTAEEFAAAIADNSVDELQLVGPIVLRDEVFPADILNVTRNLTVRGGDISNPSSLVFLNISLVKDKVQMADNVWFRCVGLVIAGGSDVVVAQANRLSLLRDQRPGEHGVVVVTDGAVLQEQACQPMPYRQVSMETRPRSAAFPGQQVVRGEVGQEGCVNVTDGSGNPSVGLGGVPFLSRCWPGRALAVDTRYPALRLVPATNKYAPTGQDLVLLNLHILCSKVLPLACVQTYGPYGCFVVTLGAQGIGGSGLPVPSFARASSPPPSAGWPSQGAAAATQPLAQGQLLQGDGGTGGASLVGPVVGGVLGGAACAAAVVAAALLVRQHKRRRSLAAPADSKGADAPDSEAPALVSATTCTEGRVSQQPGCAPPASLEDQLVSGPASMQEPVGQRPEHTQPFTADSAEALDAPAPITADTPHNPGLELAVRIRGSSSGVLAAVSDLAAHEGDSPGRRPEDAAAVPEVQLLPHTLGKGAFGSVVKGLYCGETVAVKVLAFAHIAGGNVQEGRQLRSFEQEVQVLARCRHPNVVRLLAACLDPPRPCLVMELMETSLASLMHGGAHRLLPLETVLHIGVQVARGLEYLHPTVVHRDLKPANVLLNDANSLKPVAKLADFGLSRLRTTVAATKTPDAGTPAYLAPEAYDTTSCTITHKADIYSFGVLLWEMLTGVSPWVGLSPLNIAVALVLHKQRLPMDALPPERCPLRLRRLVANMWDADPHRRPAAAEVCKVLVLVRKEMEHAGALPSAQAVATTYAAHTNAAAAAPTPLPSPWAAAHPAAPCGPRSWSAIAAISMQLPGGPAAARSPMQLVSTGEQRSSLARAHEWPRFPSSRLGGGAQAEVRHGEQRGATGAGVDRRDSWQADSVSQLQPGRSV